MSRRSQDLEELADDVLSLHARAMELQQAEVAERLLQVLEALADASPACGRFRDDVYLHIAQGAGWRQRAARACSCAGFSY